jgi:hypothetical protein
MNPSDYKLRPRALYTQEELDKIAALGLVPASLTDDQLATISKFNFPEGTKNVKITTGKPSQ